jgi:hypothetical protein
MEVELDKASGVNCAETRSAQDGLSGSGWAALLIGLSVLSIGVTGFAIDNNNIFHLPILEALWREPQFAHDPFIQSLRYFSSGFWLLQAGMADDSTVLKFFLPWLFVSRVLFFAGVASWVTLLGLKGRRQTVIFMLLVTVFSLLRSTSFAGDGGIAIRSFTHSELGNGLALIALALVWRRAYAWALVAAGLVFFLNIFMAVWLAPLMVGILLQDRRAHPVSPLRLLGQAWPGLLACLVLAIPVLASLARNPELGHKPAYDYRVYLLEHWPDHFLAMHLAPREYVGFAMVIVVLFAAAWQLPKGPARLLRMLAGILLALWAIGAVLPVLTQSPLLFNLHLLRSSTYLQILAGLALAALATRWLTASSEADRHFWGPVLVVCAVAPVFASALVWPPFALRSVWRPANGLTVARIAWLLLLVAGAGVALKIAKEYREDARIATGRAQWQALADWARTSTPPDTVFLLPVTRTWSGTSLPVEPQRMPDLLVGSEIFPTLSHRSVWVTAKYGAAALWLPGYYPVWHERMVGSLLARSLPERLAYAHSKGVGLVVDDCAVAGSHIPVYRSGKLCVFAADFPQ